MRERPSRTLTEEEAKLKLQQLHDEELLAAGYGPSPLVGQRVNRGSRKKKMPSLSQLDGERDG
jgi:hypothetical protein